MNALELTKALKGRWHGRGGMAHCPAHRDTTPSLHISVGTDGKTLVKCHAGCEQARVIDALRALGLWDGAASSNLRSFVPKTDNENGEHAMRIWQQCIPAAGTLVETYLASRKITIPIPDVLRFHPKLRHNPSGSEWPAMVARVDRGNALVAIHRTWLKLDGSGKAPVSPEKMMLGQCAGGAVRLTAPAEKLAVGEGIETCLSVLQATGGPVWSGLSASGVMALELPDSVRDVTILADAGEAGEAAALVAGRKWQNAGLTVKIARPSHKDFNDMLKAGADLIKSIQGAKPLPVDVEAIAKIENLIDRDQKINEEAARTGCFRQAVRQELKRREKSGGDKGGLPPEPEPWPEEVDGAELLKDIEAASQKHLILPPGAASAISLWALFAHAHDCFEISPILAVTSPAPECGKTTCVTLLSEITPRPLPGSNFSPAVIYRSVDAWSPTLIIDEGDTYLKHDSGMRGILDSGHNRHLAWVLRAEGDDFTPTRFSTWAPKVVAMIGRLHPTLSSRSIHIELKRKMSTETIEGLRADKVAHLLPLRRRAMRWAMDNAEKMRGAEPAMPECLTGRDADNWRPLIAVADAAGGEWPKRARSIAELFAAKESDEVHAITLLEDVRTILGDAEEMPSEDIVAELIKMDDRPWPEWKNDRPMTKAQMAKLLSIFEVKPKQKWTGGKNLRGYSATILKDAFDRYLSPLDPSKSAPNPVQTARPLGSLENKGLRGMQTARNEKILADTKTNKAFQQRV